MVVVVVEEFGGVGDGSGRGGEGDCRARLAPDGGGFIGGGGEAAMMMHYFFFEQSIAASCCGHSRSRSKSRLQRDGWGIPRLWHDWIFD